jgi:hypothetical protein
MTIDIDDKRRSTKRRRAGIAALTVLLLAGGGAAFAYWTTTGTGSGTGTSGSNAPITVVQTSTITNLRPGGAAQTLSGNFTNPNDSPTYVTSVTVSIASVTKAGGAPAGTCDATDYTLTGATMNVNAQIPIGTAQGAWTGATVAFNNKGAANQDACKGATVNFSYTSN